MSLPNHPKQNESKMPERQAEAFCCVDHRYNDKSRNAHKSYTHITQAENTMYIYPAVPLLEDTLSALLPWLDDSHSNDHPFFHGWMIPTTTITTITSSMMMA